MSKQLILLHNKGNVEVPKLQIHRKNIKRNKIFHQVIKQLFIQTVDIVCTLYSNRKDELPEECIW
ncbi:hypothetical protein J2X69_003435 [Algoriphagus sp. 4150]|nr:hypothetical protein [Algoriphagus sp. 4150]